MTKLALCSFCDLSLFLSSLCIPYSLLAQHAELQSILINETPIANLKESDWIKEVACIKILGPDNETKITINVTPDSGRIKITFSESYKAKVFLNDKLQDPLFMKLTNKIVKYKIGLKEDKKFNKEGVFFQARIGNKLRLKTTDLLILPFVVKLLNQPFRFLFPKKIKIQIFKNENT